MDKFELGTKSAYKLAVVAENNFNVGVCVCVCEFMGDSSTHSINVSLSNEDTRVPCIRFAYCAHGVKWRRFEV